MSFGPGKLVPTHKFIIRRYRPEIAKFNKGVLEWKSQELAPLKLGIRLALREQQEGRCIFCRRKILNERRNATEDIEHFLDKSKKIYRKWAFSPVNLAIACHPCNLQKTTRDMGDAAVAAARGLTANSGEYRWLHPYFDDYYENIDIQPGWIYIIKNDAPRAGRARQMIKDCMLDSIQLIEERKTKFIERLTRLQGLALRCFKSNPARAEKFLLAAQAMVASDWKDI